MASAGVNEKSNAPGDAVMCGPGYLALRAECEPPTEESEHIRDLLQAATVSGSVHYGDGTHLNKAGIEAAIPYVVSGAQKAGVTLVCSDSTLCAVDGQTRDYAGDVASAALPAGSDLLLRPAWGASFQSGGFSKAIWKAWSENNRPAIQVLVAGNDLSPTVDALAVTREMRRVREWWSKWDIRVLFVDVVPSGYHHH